MVTINLQMLDCAGADSAVCAPLRELAATEAWWRVQEHETNVCGCRLCRPSYRCSCCCTVMMLWETQTVCSKQGGSEAASCCVQHAKLNRRVQEPSAARHKPSSHNVSLATVEHASPACKLQATGSLQAYHSPQAACSGSGCSSGGAVAPTGGCEPQVSELLILCSLWSGIVRSTCIQCTWTHT